MWFFEDIQALNPIEPDQKISFLQHIIDIGSASEGLLCRTAEALDQRDGPFVAAFAQIPFVFSCSDSPFVVPGLRKDVLVELNFNTIDAHIDLSGKLILEPSMNIDNKDIGIFQITQVTAFVPLWTKRARLHKAYLECISPRGFSNNVIGQIEDWMNIPEAKLALPKRRYAPLTAQAFQAEVSIRIRRELEYTLNSFLTAYSIANLVELPQLSTLHGYFAMVAPGRIASASTPVPIASGLCVAQKATLSEGVSSDRVKNLLNKHLPMEDRILTQLMAMHRLLNQGEPELALIGCASVIEWFFNLNFPWIVRRKKNGQKHSASIVECLKGGVLEFLSVEQRNKLKKLSEARNDLVHGDPPVRVKHSWQSKKRNFIVDDKYVKDSLFLALKIYHTVNKYLNDAYTQNQSKT